jgi:SAM-dependent methyltransferase
MASDIPQFATRDPRTAQFWDERFENGFTPWDERVTPGALVNWLQANPPQQGTRVFIPGAGAAHEVSTFASLGCKPSAVDISAAAVHRARWELGERQNFVEQGDAFSYEPETRFDWMYERAFLCALPPDMHVHWQAMTRRVLRPNGLLIGFFFVRDKDSDKGPPFAITHGTLNALLAPDFVCQLDQPYETGLKAFDGGVRWQVWRRK